MVDNDDNDMNDIGELLRKHYQPKIENDPETFVANFKSKVDALFHVEMFSEKEHDENGKKLTDEERYNAGLESYVDNKISSTKHREITEHLLQCKECRKNYNKLLDKKKVLKAS